MKQAAKAKEESNDERQRRMLADILTCPVCGERKMHSRLYGYRCRIPEHARQTDDATIDKWLKQQRARLGSGGKNRRIK